MKTEKFLKTWNGALSENVIHRVVTGIMAVVVLVALTMATSKEQVTIIQPFTMHEQGWVGETAASQTYKESFAVALALIIGNLTPKSVDFIKERVEPMLSTTIYQSAIEEMETQAQIIKENRLTYRFELRGVEYEPETDKVFVTGDAFVKASTGDEKKSTRTFEFVIGVSGYHPQINYMESYDGRARTLKQRAKIEANKGK